jgi:hypothetical protein
MCDFDFLEDETNERWVSADCPGKRLPDEINDRRSKFFVRKQID